MVCPGFLEGHFQTALDYGLANRSSNPIQLVAQRLRLPMVSQSANAVKVDPANRQPDRGTGDPYNGLVIPGNSFPRAARGRVPVADTGEFQPAVPQPAQTVFRHSSAAGLQPRVGLAYGFNSKTVVRAGIGRYNPSRRLVTRMFSAAIRLPTQQLRYPRLGGTTRRSSSNLFPCR